MLEDYHHQRNYYFLIIVSLIYASKIQTYYLFIPYSTAYSLIHPLPYVMHYLTNIHRRPRPNSLRIEDAVCCLTNVLLFTFSCHLKKIHLPLFTQLCLFRRPILSIAQLLFPPNSKYRYSEAKQGKKVCKATAVQCYPCFSYQRLLLLARD